MFLFLAISGAAVRLGALPPQQAAAPGVDPQARKLSAPGSVAGDGSAGPLSLDSQSAEVQTLFRLTNESRVAQGLGALTWSPQLAAAAQTHARLMAASKELSHRYPGEAELAARAVETGAHFFTIAENIALGSSARQIEQQWMESVPHRANLLDPHVNVIGVAIVASSSGTLYAVEDSAARSANLSMESVEQKVEAELAVMGIHQADRNSPMGSPERLKEQTRENCSLEFGSAIESAAGMLSRWEGPDLTLPKTLADAAMSHEFGSAAVGACPPLGSADPAFTTYRVAVLLF